ncbi:MAG: DUF4118 domain-containing protein [Acidimicrobiales bacterium]
MDRDERLPTAVGAFIGVVGSIMVAGLLSNVGDWASNVNVALVLMVVVVLGAAAGGRAAGAVSAGAAALAFDFFQTQPYHSLRIGSRDDVETAVLLLVGGLIVGQIAARAQIGRVAVEAGRTEIRRIHHLAELTAQGHPSSDVIDAATTQLTQLLSLQSCRFERPPYTDTFERLEHSGVVTAPKRPISMSRMGRHGLELPGEGVELPVLNRGRDIGRFVLVPTPGEGASLEQRVVAVALADQVGAAVTAGESADDDRDDSPSR